MENTEENYMEVSKNNIKKIGAILMLIFGAILNIKVDHANQELFDVYKVTGSFMVAIFFFWHTISLKDLGFRRGRLSTALLVWSVFLVSCFTLNLSLSIFGESVLWLQIAVVFSLAAHVAYAFFENSQNKLLKNTILVALCFSLVLWIYFAAILIKIYPIALIGLVVLGVGFHAFVPLLTVIVLVKILFWKEFKTNGKIVVVSFLLPVLTFVIYTLFTFYQINTINTLKKDAQLSSNFNIPDWVKVAQKIKSDSFAANFLREELSLREFNTEDPWRLMPQDFGSDTRVHDPLYMLGSLLHHKSNLTTEDRIAILETKFDGRHQTEERLWSGDNLSLPSIVTAINLYPKNRIAYTEKTIYIHNSGENGSWSNNEALFTFYLPEQSTVSSLSLWIEGKEGKGVLTTKSKAQKAYKQIVGVENRDPAVVHWQEGNRVTLRVFPCNAGADRIVKIGISSPLEFDKKSQTLTYNSIAFKGPNVNDTKEDITIVSDHNMEIHSGQIEFDKISKANWKYRGDFENNWLCKFPAPALENAAFSFNNSSYTLHDYSPTLETIAIDNIYLDLDYSWDKSLVLDILKTATHKKVWIYDTDLVQLTEENLDYYYDITSKNAFNLFPISLIEDPKTSVLITNMPSSTPLLKDLNGLDIFKSKHKSPIRTYVINDISPYLKTLKELGNIQTQKVNKVELKRQLKAGLFSVNIEDQNRIVLEHAGLSIAKAKSPVLSNSNNDHLTRIFAYNAVMEGIGNSYDSLARYESDFIKNAEIGNVVTPVSSLVVLETAADYERFGIKKSDNGLPNASFKKGGAVPEPHEWALIIISIFVITFLYFKR